MNARRRIVPDGLPNRVYEKSGSWYWFPKNGKWIRLCRVEAGEPKMLERLAAEKRKHESMTGTGNMPPLIDEYVKAKRGERREKGWFRYGNYAKLGFADVNIEQIDNAYVVEFLEKNWKDKLAMQRAMRAFLSGFFQWCRERRYMNGENPCAGMRMKGPKPRDVYLTDAHFGMIRARLEAHPMILCLVDLCYLTMQRSTEIRTLRWKREDQNSNWVDREKGVLHFKPSKTIDTTGAAVDCFITPEIEEVLHRAKAIGKVKSALVVHTAKGGFWRSTAALKFWREACNDAGLERFGYTIRDLRAKALTDAQKSGHAMEALKVAADHSDVKTTEIYMKDRAIPVSSIRLSVPKSA